jgi:hypothetical protein
MFKLRGNNKRVAAMAWCITNTSPLTLKLPSRASSDVFLKGMMCDHRSEPLLWSGGCGCHLMAMLKCETERSESES